jgi:hypothetical protein
MLHETSTHHTQPQTCKSMRTTKRPLQTYGKRAASVAGKENQQPAKRQRRDLENAEEQQPPTTPAPKIDSKHLQPLSMNAVARSGVSAFTAKKKSGGSIMAYFQRHPATKVAESAEHSSDAPILTSTAPSSPPVAIKVTRARRRLHSRPERILDKEEVQQEDTSDRDTTKPLQLEGLPDTAAADQPQRRKRKSHELTQTTLSLSMDDDPGFTICDVCHILYNPLNEKDRREHSRRHAAFCRSAKRTSEALLSTRSDDNVQV